jgi:hypothetical protein
MTLSPPVPREALHTRAITITGYQRADGMFDIEATTTAAPSKPASRCTACSCG